MINARLFYGVDVGSGLYQVGYIADNEVYTVLLTFNKDVADQKADEVLGKLIAENVSGMQRLHLQNDERCVSII